FDAWMMVPGWVRGKTTPESAGLKLAEIVRHIDHICQLAGNSEHCGIGSDLDGAFGTEQTPADLKSIGDLQGFPGLPAENGRRWDGGGCLDDGSRMGARKDHTRIRGIEAGRDRAAHRSHLPIGGEFRTLRDRKRS